MRGRILALLNVRTDEAWLVTNLFWLQFFQGVGVAIFNTVAFVFFLQHFDVTELPKVYLFSALLLWLSGWIYSKFEHAVHIKNLVLGVIVFIALSILAFRLQVTFNQSSLVMFLMFSWFYVIYLLSNLEFWGVAALSFDIRQSKRLFGMIGAGDIPAKLIGYSAVPLIIGYVGSENMLFFSFGSFLVSLIFYFKLRRAGKLDLHVKHDHSHAHQAHGHATQGAMEIIKGFFGNRMIAMVAGLSFIVVSCVTIISFSFYSEVKHEAHTDVQLANFIGLFYAGGRVIAIFIRLIFTGRISSIMGTKGTLLISPAILFISLVVVLVMLFVPGNKHAVLYMFGLMAILTEVLKTSLQDPVFLSLMQPLSSNLRLKGHTIVKGVMDPFALAFSGFMLYTVVAISHHVDLLLIGYMVFILLIIWVVMIFLVDREYVRTLITALNKRYSIGQEMDLTDEKTKNVLRLKVSSGERGEAIYILNLIEKEYKQENEELVLLALQHPKEEVQMQAIKLAERQKIYAALPYIDKIIASGTDSALLPEAVKAKCMIQPDELEILDEFLNEKDHRLTKAAITGFMTSGGINGVVTAGQKLLHLISSSAAEDRKMAAEIIGELRVQSFFRPLLDLLKDSNEEVVQAAIVASGKVKNEKLMGPLMRFFLDHRNEKQVADAFHEAGDVSLREVERTLTHEKLSHRQRAKLILICGRIGTENATKILDLLVWELPAFRNDVFHALYMCEFKSQPHNRQQHVALMGHYLTYATRILFMIQALQNNKTAKILTDALYIELDDIRGSLLMLFSFVYNREKMIKVKSAFQVNHRENIANALEVLEIEVPKDISLKFIRIFEPGDIGDKCAQLRPYFKDELTYEMIIDEILKNKHHHFHRWTKAAALHSVIFYKGKEKALWLEHAQQENDILLYETAGKIKSEMN